MSFIFEHTDQHSILGNAMFVSFGGSRLLLHCMCYQCHEYVLWEWQLSQQPQNSNLFGPVTPLHCPS